MNTATVRFRSAALERHAEFTAILPDLAAAPGPYPVLYQLHGYSDDHPFWMLSANLVRHVARWPLIVILPDGATSFWINRSPRERYEDLIVEDLMPHVSRMFHVRPGPSAVGGQSMGGFGSLHLALKYPDRFASVWAHSSAIFTFDQLLQKLDLAPEQARDADLYELAARIPADQRPAIAFDCGRDDFLIEHNRRFHAYLEEKKIPHIYHEHPGQHSWEYWEAHIPTALARHAEVLGLKEIPRQ
ncbi:MAG: esterase family protein [bacterium]|nr:esterase family protein [bacterium]